MQVTALCVGARKPDVAQLTSFHPCEGVMGVGSVVSQANETDCSRHKPTKHDEHQALPPCWSGWVRGVPSRVTIVWIMQATTPATSMAAETFSA